MLAIDYEVKNTLARTEYRKTKREDLKKVLDYMEQWMLKMDAFSKSDVDELKEIYDDFWCAKTKDLPKGRDGLNSPQSMCAGILGNMRYGEHENVQFDLTKPQCDGIQQISACINVCFPTDCPKIQFTKVTKL